MDYGIWCVVSGGLTGRREAWLKGKDGRRATYRDRAEAEAEAARLNVAMNGVNRRADFRYSVIELSA